MKPDRACPEKATPEMLAALLALDALTDEERLEVIGCFCSHCGKHESENGSCQCWNDE